MNRKNLFLAVLFGSMIGCGGANGASSWSSGDRVLVAKCLYDTHAAEPQRYNVVVFKYPQAPVDKGTPKNYIKRLIGLPGEIIAIFFGQLYRWAPQDGQEVPYRKEDEGMNPNRLWQQTHTNDPFAQKLFDHGQFEILRKPPDVMMALHRIVYDNDYQPSDLVNMVKPRWNQDATKGWKADGGKGFVHKDDNDAIDWLRYQHLVYERSAERPPVGNREVKPQLITDRMGYNSDVLLDKGRDGQEHLTDETPPLNWVGDLMLECNLDVEKAHGEFILELSKSTYRYQARWNLADGVCTLVRIGSDGKEENLDSKPTRLKGTGSYLIRFANFDARLTVWVDRELPFNEGCSYSPPEVWASGEREKVETKIRAKIRDDDPQVEKALADFLLARRGPTENDLQPASVGSKAAAIAVKHLRLWRDTYYTTEVRGPDYPLRVRDVRDDTEKDSMPKEAWSDPARSIPPGWAPLRQQTYRTMYVQPGHYLCLGDNSTASSDGREWGLVPQRLMLGRALAVYFPILRLGPIR